MSRLGVLGPVSMPGASMEPGLAGGAGGGARHGDLLSSPRSPGTDLLGSGALGWKRVGNHQGAGQETTRGVGVGSQGHAVDPRLLGVQPWQVEGLSLGKYWQVPGPGVVWGALPWARAAHMGFLASQKGSTLQSVGWGA